MSKNQGKPAAKHPSDPQLLRYASLPAATVSDAMDGLGLPRAHMGQAVKRLAGTHLVGRARTIDRTPAPTNARQADFDPKLGMGTYRVIDSVQPGTVIVIAARGDVSAALWGGNMANRARQLGATGVVTDGAVRDLDEIEEMKLAVFAGGTAAPAAPPLMVTLSIDQPIICGGVRVRPGDIIVGDCDGVVVVPQEKADQIADKSESLLDTERVMRKFVADGNTLVAAVEKYKVR